MPENASVSQVESSRDAALAELAAARTDEQIEAWRIAWLGRRGQLTQVLRGIRDLSPDERRSVGAAANRAKSMLEQHLAQRQDDLARAKSEAEDRADAIDVTLPGWHTPVGGLHPTTQMIREICDAFGSMGFDVVEGPEVEWDLYNFEMLNIPRGHAARDMWATLWVDEPDEDGDYPMLMRTQTSPMQIRTMQQRKPPIRVVVPGKCYRYEATDATHEWHFYQVEGLAVDKGITFADLKGTLYEFARRIFGEERQVRFRCDYFPFVEPGVDMSISNFKDPQTGKRPINRDEDWIEILGAGMVHPKVLEGVGLDPQIYTGFAFGMGPERISMLKYGIEDIRLFYSNDLRFLSQF
ncbi:MAG: phenylalanine--tRNA ligase subunit alpha [Chloroflexi bacterium]|nr:phenylalanine--tRNA ligase subunit alpha [Chloroflexota bacterium]